MKLEKYQQEILIILNEKYPATMKKNTLLSLLEDKDPERLKKEISYLKEKGFITLKKFEIPAPLPLLPPLEVPIGYKITAKGIDSLKEVKRSRTIREIQRKVDRPTAFISASFDDKVDEIVNWARNRAENSGINTIWLKEIYKARPTLDKIIDAIQETDCIIQIITQDIIERGGEAGWIGNELGFAIIGHPGRNVAIFCEEGLEPSGAGKALTDIFWIDRQKLAKRERKAEEYLLDLREKCSQNTNSEE